MKRTTIAMPDDLARVVEQEAQRRSTSVSEVIRAAVFQVLIGTERRKPGFAGICEEPGLPAGADLEEALAEEEWVRDIDRRG